MSFDSRYFTCTNIVMLLIANWYVTGHIISIYQCHQTQTCTQIAPPFIVLCTCLPIAANELEGLHIQNKVHGNVSLALSPGFWI